MPTLIDEQFADKYRDFIYLFITSDGLLSNLHLAKRNIYYRKAEELLNNPVFRQEFEEVRRQLYHLLATKAKDEEERQLYKGSLLFAQLLRDRINNLAKRSPEKVEQSNKEAIKTIDNLLK